MPDALLSSLDGNNCLSCGNGAPKPPGEFVKAFREALAYGEGAAADVFTAQVQALHHRMYSMPIIADLRELTPPKTAFALALNTVGNDVRGQPFMYPSQSGAAEKHPAEYRAFAAAAAKLKL